MKYLDRLSLCFCFIFYFNKNISLLSFTFSLHTRTYQTPYSLFAVYFVCFVFSLSLSFFRFLSFSFFLSTSLSVYVKVVFIATILAPIDTRYYNCTVFKYSGLECRLCDLPIAIINCFTHEYDSTASYLLSAERPKRNRDHDARMRSTKKCMRMSVTAAREKKLRSVKKVLDTLRFLIIHSKIMSISEHNSYRWANQIEREKKKTFNFNIFLYIFLWYGI